MLHSRRRFLAALSVAPFVAACGSVPDPLRPVATTPPTATPPLRLACSGATTPLIQSFVGQVLGRDNDPVEFVRGTSISSSIEAVRSGSVDIAVIHRPIESLSRRMPGLHYHPIGRDAAVFAVNQPNTVAGLSSEEARAIYRGEHQRWQSLGGSAEPIIILDLTDDELLRELFLAAFMGSQPVEARRVELDSSRELLRAIAMVPSSIGYGTLSTIRALNTSTVRVLPLDGVTPGIAALKAGRYPWSVTIGAVARPPYRPAVERFLETLGSAEGRQHLELLDVYPLSP